MSSAMWWTERLAAFAVLFASLEWIALWPQRFFRWKRGTLAPLMMVRLMAAAVVLTGAIPNGPLFLVIALCTAIARKRVIGLSGAEQMNVTLCIALCLPVPDAICLWFIALQSALAYCAAGISKYRTKGWWEGTYLRAVAGTDFYGHPWAVRLLDNKGRARWISRAVIVWESAFPLALVAGPEFCAAYLVSGFLFHVANAMLMGLHPFVWSFAATYPAVWYCAGSFRLH